MENRKKMLSWTKWILTASYAVGAHATSSTAHVNNLKEVYQLMHQQQQRMHSQQYGDAAAAAAASTSERNNHHQDKLPAQPIHRSILSRRKRRILPGNDERSNSEKEYATTATALLRRAKDRDGTTPENNGTNIKNELQPTAQPNDEGSSSSSPPLPPETNSSPVLASNLWVKITEEVGRNSFNFVPESRRAASSVMFTYKYHKHRLLTEEEGDGGMIMGGAMNDTSTNATMEFLTMGIEIDDVDNNNMINSTSNNGTTTEEAEMGGESDEAINIDNQDEGIIQQTLEASNITNNTEDEAMGHDDTSESQSQPTIQDSPDSTDFASTEEEEEEEEEEEYMIISGGYTDHDWKSFPVYAFPVTSSVRTLRGRWIDLSPSALEDNVETRHCIDEDGAAAREKLYREATYLDNGDDVNADADDATNDNPWDHAQNCPPSGRMGHASVVHDGKLYVFGGLIYDEEGASGSGNGHGRKETFRLEDVPFVYRLDLNEMFETRRAQSEEGRNNNRDAKQRTVTGWQRIVPRVTPFSTPNGMSSTSAAEVLLTSVNRGEMQGGLWSSGGRQTQQEQEQQHDKFVMYGGLRIAKLEYEGSYKGHDKPSKFVKGKDAFGSRMRSHKIVELPLGDVWAYDLVLDSWEKVTNNYGRAVKGGEDEEGDGDAVLQGDETTTDDDDWWYDLDTSLFPRPRTAHAATVVGDELVIHGGMGWNEQTNDWDGSTDWETLDDMWILNLKTRKWTRRWLFPLLVRSYHSLVGWSVDENPIGWGKDYDNCTSWKGPVVAAFGGYTTGMDVFSGEELAYVFEDLLVSYPPPRSTDFAQALSPWMKASMSVEGEGSELISTRYEHSAVLSEQGVLVIWGGSFQDTSGVKGLWMINIAGGDSCVNLSMAEEDSIYNDYERTITALHTIVIMLMFMSISLTLLLGLTQRYQELVQQANDDAAVAAGVAFAAQDFSDSPPIRRRNGLHPEIIDTLPEKIYSASEANDGNGETEQGNQDCCPICLVDYEDGDELRVLPCNHFMHKTCLDAWLVNNPSCPTCRHSLSELVDDRPMMQLRTLRSRLSNNSALARFLGHDHAMGINGIEMTDFSDGSLPRDAVIDLRYVSRSPLAPPEEDATMERSGGDQRQGDNAEDTPVQMTAMEELSSWRRQRRQLQRERRRSSMASFRQNVSRFRRDQRRRIPLADLDEE